MFKLPQFFIQLVLFIGLLTYGCATDAGEVNSTPANPAAVEQPSEAPPKSSGYDEMDSDYYETNTRVIWQKPELVLELLGELESRKIADIGAGTGYFAFRIATQGGEVIAIDVDERAVSYMESEKIRYPGDVQSKFTARLAEYDDPKLLDAEVDVVLMVNTYIYLEDRIAYLAKVSAGLKPGGEILIIDFKNVKTTIGPDLAERIPQSQVENELRRAGYTIGNTDVETLEYQYIVRATKQ